jgi:hypothetical protein
VLKRRIRDSNAPAKWFARFVVGYEAVEDDSERVVSMVEHAVRVRPRCLAEFHPLV